MSEIYKNTTEYVYLDIYGGTADSAPTATCYDPINDPATLTVESDTPPDRADQRWVAVVNLAHTQEVGEVRVEWDFTMDGIPVKKADYMDVVVPLVTLGEIKSNLDIDDEYTDLEILNTERRVRKIIEAYTGQEFAARDETLVLHGTGAQTVKSPKRVISVSSVNNNEAASNGVLINNNGWGLTKLYPYYSTDIKSGGWPITHPYDRNYYQWTGRYWNISGRFGWERVPVEVQEAAFILIEQELCTESLYRNRYIETMTAADWRIEFVPDAYVRTGNVVADQILAKFVMNNSAVF